MVNKLNCFLIIILFLITSRAINSQEANAPDDDYKGWITIDLAFVAHGHYRYNTAFMGQLKTKFGTKLKLVSSPQPQRVQPEAASEENELEFYFYFKINQVIKEQFKATVNIMYIDASPSSNERLKSYKEQNIAGTIGINNQYQFSYDESEVSIFFKLNKPDQSLIAANYISQ